MGKEFSQHDRDFGDKTADQIDQEIHKIINNCYSQAKKILFSKKSILRYIAQELMKKEVIEGEELDKILQKNNS